MSVTQGIPGKYTPGKYAEFIYSVTGAVDETAAYDELAAAVPAFYQGIPRKEISVETEHIDISGDASANRFKGTVKYYLQLAETGDITSFDTTGGTQKITQSIATVNAYPAGSPNLQGAINFDGEKVNGVDIGIGAYAFVEQHYKTSLQCDQNYRVTLANMSYTVNNAPFRGFAASEVLFKGAVGQQVVVNGITQWQISYHFACSPNRSNFYVGGILVDQKYGWDYLWTLYADVVSGNRVVKAPAHVYIERVYYPADFGGLEI